MNQAKTDKRITKNFHFETKKQVVAERNGLKLVQR